MRVNYRTESGTESTAYLDDGEGDTRTGADKYTDEPVTVRWDGAHWVEVGAAPARYALFKALFLPSEGMSRASVDGLIDAYAHELAEQQRTWALDYDHDEDSSYDYTYALTLGAKLA